MMNHAIIYACEKFTDAIALLKKGPAPLKERFRFAAQEITLVRAPELPEPLRGRVKAVQARLTKRDPEGDEGRIAATVNAMPTASLVAVAVEITELAADLRSHRDAA